MLVQEAKVGEDIVDCGVSETDQYLAPGIDDEGRRAVHQLIIHIVKVVAVVISKKVVNPDFVTFEMLSLRFGWAAQVKEGLQLKVEVAVDIRSCQVSTVNI